VPSTQGLRFSLDLKRLNQNNVPYSFVSIEIAISAVTVGEFLYGLARRSCPALLGERVRQFLLRVDVPAWNHDVTRAYADLRASCARIVRMYGRTLAPLDMMIAAQAVAADAVLVTNDQAIRRSGVLPSRCRSRPGPARVHLDGARMPNRC